MTKAGTGPMNILLVEDDESLNRGISFKLNREGYRVASAVTVKQADELFHTQQIDFILLDVTLPDGNGFDFCRQLREEGSNVHILFLTACDRETDIVTGYDTGADDYLTKPFSLAVLLSKINAFARRHGSMAPDQQTQSHASLKSGMIELLPDEMRLLKGGVEIPLSKNEFKLIRFFMENAQQILSRDQILMCLWDSDGNFVDENTVAVNIRRLREKIEDDPSNPIYIVNIRGIGYKWQQRCART